MMALGDTRSLGPTPLSVMEGAPAPGQLGPEDLNAPATPFAPAPNPHLRLHVNHITLVSHT